MSVLFHTGSVSHTPAASHQHPFSSTSTTTLNSQSAQHLSLPAVSVAAAGTPPASTGTGATVHDASSNSNVNTTPSPQQQTPFSTSAQPLWWPVSDEAFWRRPIGVEHVNWLIKVCGIVQENPIYSLRQCSSSLFVLLFQRLLNYPIPDLELEPNNHEKKLWNTRRVLEELSAVGETDLSYISATDIVNCNEDHISLLVRVFLHLALHLIQAQRGEGAQLGGVSASHHSDPIPSSSGGVAGGGASASPHIPPNVGDAALESHQGVAHMMRSVEDDEQLQREGDMSHEHHVVQRHQQPYFTPPPPLGAPPSASPRSNRRHHPSHPSSGPRYTDASHVTSMGGLERDDVQRLAEQALLEMHHTNTTANNGGGVVSPHFSADPLAQWNAADGGGYRYVAASSDVVAPDVPRSQHHYHAPHHHIPSPSTAASDGDDSATFTNDLVASWQQEVVPPPRRTKGSLVDPVSCAEVQHRIEALEGIANRLLQRSAVPPLLRRHVFRPDHGTRYRPTAEEETTAPWGHKRAAVVADNALRDAKIAALQAGRRQRDVQDRYLREAVREQSIRERELVMELRRHRAAQRSHLCEEKARVREEEVRMVAAVDALVSSSCRLIADGGLRRGFPPSAAAAGGHRRAASLKRPHGDAAVPCVALPSESTLRVLKDQATVARESRRVAEDVKRSEDWEARRRLSSYQSQVTSWRRSSSVLC